MGVEGTASWGRHIALALAGAGMDVREPPPSAAPSSDRLAKTDTVDAAAARALLAEPTLGPAQALELNVETVLSSYRSV